MLRADIKKQKVADTIKVLILFKEYLSISLRLNVITCKLKG